MARAHPWAIAAVAALTSIGSASSAHGADATLERIAAGLRANELKSVRYSGDGVGWTFGQVQARSSVAEDQAQFMDAHGQLRDWCCT